MTTAKSSWKAMRTRCTNKNQPHYDKYGGRGITYCVSWAVFDCFLEDMGEPPTPKHTLERIDNDGNYTPRNCKWATYTEQANNKRNNILIFVDGVEDTLSNWCRKFSVKQITAHMRIKRGWPPYLAVSKAATHKNNKNYKLFEFRGEVLTLSEIAFKVGINYHTLRQRVITNGEDIYSAISRPVKSK